MPRSSSGGLIGEILHTTAVRLRATGAGNLQLFLRSLDDVNNVQLSNIPLSSTTNREPTVLANFNEQRVQLEIRTSAIDETFTISRIIIFVKPVAEGYPIT